MDFDISVFFWIDTRLQSPFMTAFMQFITQKKNFIIPGIVLAGVIFFVERKKGLMFLISLLILIGINDAITHHFLKAFFMRARPCQVLPWLEHIPHCASSYSFPSNHASNIFVLATFSTLMYRNSSLLALSFALMVCLSRVYLGHHYFTDVLGGAFCGIVIGYLGFKAHPVLWQAPIFSSKTLKWPTWTKKS